MPITGLAGWAIYAERIDLLMVLGTALILLGNLLNLLNLLWMPARG